MSKNVRILMGGHIIIIYKSHIFFLNIHLNAIPAVHIHNLVSQITILHLLIIFRN